MFYFLGKVWIMRVVLQAAIALSLIAAAVEPVLAQTAASAYTVLDLKKCRHTPGKDVEDYGEWSCASAGYNGIGVYVAAGDQRSYVSYGRKASEQPAAKQTLASFNGEGKTIEWRGERGADGVVKPYATIMRWSTAVLNDAVEPVKGQVLVVTRLGPGGVCHVGYVDARANPDANALAQKIADENARAFKCDADKPIVLGNKGPGFSGPYGE
jgi:hypothetical protein